MRRIPGYFGALLILMTITGQVAAMCHLETFSVNKVQGQITQIDGRKGFPDPPLSHTKVVLKRLTDEGDIPAGETESDENGFFEIEAVSKGKYRLTVHIMVNGKNVDRPYDVILKVRKSKAKKSRKFVHVSMSYNCFETTAGTFTRKF